MSQHTTHQVQPQAALAQPVIDIDLTQIAPTTAGNQLPPIQPVPTPTAPASANNRANNNEQSAQAPANQISDEKKSLNTSTATKILETRPDPFGFGLPVVDISEFEIIKDLGGCELHVVNEIKMFNPTTIEKTAVVLVGNGPQRVAYYVKNQQLFKKDEKEVNVTFDLNNDKIVPDVLDLSRPGKIEKTCQNLDQYDYIVEKISAEIIKKYWPPKISKQDMHYCEIHHVQEFKTFDPKTIAKTAIIVCGNDPKKLKTRFVKDKQFLVGIEEKTNKPIEIEVDISGIDEKILNLNPLGQVRKTLQNTALFSRFVDLTCTKILKKLGRQHLHDNAFSHSVIHVKDKMGREFIVKDPIGIESKEDSRTKPEHIVYIAAEESYGVNAARLTSHLIGWNINPECWVGVGLRNQIFVVYSFIPACMPISDLKDRRPDVRFRKAVKLGSLRYLMARIIIAMHLGDLDADLRNTVLAVVSQQTASTPTPGLSPMTCLPPQEFDNSGQPKTVEFKQGQGDSELEPGIIDCGQTMRQNGFETRGFRYLITEDDIESLPFPSNVERDKDDKIHGWEPYNGHFDLRKRGANKPYTDSILFNWPDDLTNPFLRAEGNLTIFAGRLQLFSLLEESDSHTHGEYTPRIKFRFFLFERFMRLHNMALRAEQLATGQEQIDPATGKYSELIMAILENEDYRNKLREKFRKNFLSFRRNGILIFNEKTIDIKLNEVFSQLDKDLARADQAAQEEPETPRAVIRPVIQPAPQPVVQATQTQVTQNNPNNQNNSSNCNCVCVMKWLCCCPCLCIAWCLGKCLDPGNNVHTPGAPGRQTMGDVQPQTAQLSTQPVRNQPAASTAVERKQEVKSNVVVVQPASAAVQLAAAHNNETETLIMSFSSATAKRTGQQLYTVPDNPVQAVAQSSNPGRPGAQSNVPATQTNAGNLISVVRRNSPIHTNPGTQQPVRITPMAAHQGAAASNATNQGHATPAQQQVAQRQNANPATNGAIPGAANMHLPNVVSSSGQSLQIPSLNFYAP